MFKEYKIAPWFQLFAKQRKAEKEHQSERLVNSRSVANGLRQKRKEYLGSDLGLTMFVHEDGQPLEAVVEALSGYLGNLTTYFLENDHHCFEQEELCIGFFYYALQLYAHNKIGDDSFDDLIQLAELFGRDVEVFTILMEQDLTEDIVNEWKDFVTENEHVPGYFSEAVTGAIAVFLGVLKDPTDDAA